MNDLTIQEMNKVLANTLTVVISTSKLPECFNVVGTVESINGFLDETDSIYLDEEQRNFFASIEDKHNYGVFSFSFLENGVSKPLSFAVFELDSFYASLCDAITNLKETASTVVNDLFGKVSKLQVLGFMDLGMQIADHRMLKVGHLATTGYVFERAYFNAGGAMVLQLEPGNGEHDVLNPETFYESINTHLQGLESTRNGEKHDPELHCLIESAGRFYVITDVVMRDLSESIAWILTSPYIPSHVDVAEKNSLAETLLKKPGN